MKPRHLTSNTKYILHLSVFMTEDLHVHLIELNKKKEPFRFKKKSERENVHKYILKVIITAVH